MFEPTAFAAIAGWDADLKLGAFEAFRRSAFHALEKPYRTGSLGIRFESFSEAYEAARIRPALTDVEAQAFFETFFRPLRVRPDNGQPHGLVTGFYEPIVEASPLRSEHFNVPLLVPPADLVPVDDTNRPAGMDPYLAWARQTPDGLVEYHDRQAIESGALPFDELALAWLRDPVDAFFIHVQGAARLQMTGGTEKRVTYAAKSGQRFTGPGRVLLNLGELQPGTVSMQSIRAWLETHPNRVEEILWKNRSYIFFREAPVSDPALGPVAAAKVPLTPGRSIAVDRLLHTFGTPFFVSSPTLQAFDHAPLARLMIAQDTGSAITGSARADLFTGSGDAAGAIAGVVNHPADFIALVPRAG